LLEIGEQDRGWTAELLATASGSEVSELSFAVALAGRAADARRRGV